MKLMTGKCSLRAALAGLVLVLAGQVNAGSLPDFTELAESNTPAVVNISSSQKVVSTRMPKGLDIPELEDTPLGDLFKHFFGEGGRMPPELKSRSLGSGFIISDDGYVLTNYHVVDSADQVVVRLSDRREFVARVIGADKRSDIALIKIDAGNLPVVRIGSSTDLKVGEWVLAIGSPFGFDHSVTAGIVSAKGRSLPSENYVPFIQTDVAINPGNSGGPLFDLDGEVVGVNSQIYSRTGGFMGLSFAIPIEVAMNVVEQLKTKGHVTRGWLGVLIQDVTRELAEAFGMTHPHGALIAQVLPDSPAEKAGLQVGDIITDFNGQRLKNSSALPPMVGASRIDRPAQVNVIRNGRKLKIPVNIGELPSEDELQLGVIEPLKIEENRLGITVSDLTAAQRKRLKIGTESGVLVDSVEQDSPAHDAGIHKGDVILMLNKFEVGSVSELEQRIKELPKGKSVAVLVQREAERIFLPLRVPD